MNIRIGAVFRQNVICAENGASSCRKRLSESRELPQACSADAKFIFGSNSRLRPANKMYGVRAAVLERYGWSQAA